VDWHVSFVVCQSLPGQTEHVLHQLWGDDIQPNTILLVFPVILITDVGIQNNRILLAMMKNMNEGLCIWIHNEIDSNCKIISPVFEILYTMTLNRQLCPDVVFIDWSKEYSSTVSQWPFCSHFRLWVMLSIPVSFFFMFLVMSLFSCR
jgi:hypothetical protein